MQNKVQIKLSRGLKLKVVSADGNFSIDSKLDRIEAQRLADALMSYAGSERAVMNWEREAIFSSVPQIQAPTPKSAADFTQAFLARVRLGLSMEAISYA